VGPAAFHAFSNVEQNVREQIQKVRSHPWIPHGIAVRGFVYDVNTGRLSEVTAAEVKRSTA
jgi:carbonic anhydrase